MRDIIVIGVVITLITVGSVFTSKFYKETYDEFCEKLDELAETIEKEVDKEEKIQELESLWKEKENILIIFQDHSLIGEIEEDLYECFQYYRYEEKDHFDATKEKIIMEIEDLIKREEFSIVNIL